MEIISLNHLTIVLAGMLIMTCVLGSIAFLHGKRWSSNIQLNDHPSTPLRWWAGALSVVLTIGFTASATFNFPDNALAALNFHIIAVDMLLLPLSAIVMVLIVAPQHITWTRILVNFVPFIILCPLCWVINQSWYTYAVALGMVGYIIAMMVYIMIVGTHYEKTLMDEYSSLQGRSTKWLLSVLVFMVLILLDFALFSAYRSGWDRLLYNSLNLVAWNIVFSRIHATVLLREKADAYELDVKELAREEEEEKERELLMSEDTETFTKRLNELINRDQVYNQDDLTRDDLAKLMGMSHTTFSKLLKVTTGQNFYEYINGLRIDKATELIKEGKMDVWSVGQAVGYRYRSTFYRAFAAKHGCTPAEYVEK